MPKENLKRKTKGEVLAWVAEMRGENKKQELQGLRNQARELLVKKGQMIDSGLPEAEAKRQIIAIEAIQTELEKQIRVKDAELESWIKSNKGKRLVIADENTPSASVSRMKKEVEVL